MYITRVYILLYYNITAIYYIIYLNNSLRTTIMYCICAFFFLHKRANVYIHYTQYTLLFYIRFERPCVVIHIIFISFLSNNTILTSVTHAEHAKPNVDKYLHFFLLSAKLAYSIHTYFAHIIIHVYLRSTRICPSLYIMYHYIRNGYIIRFAGNEKMPARITRRGFQDILSPAKSQKSHLYT